jgi:hypothetical protein
MKALIEPATSFGALLQCSLVLLLVVRGVPGSARAAGPYEPVSLSIGVTSTNGVVSSNPLRFSGYQLLTSADLVRWDDSGVFFGPARNTQVFAFSGIVNRYFRLKADDSMALACAGADATTVQLNWPPIPSAVEYKMYRDGAYIGSTAGRCGYFLDTGLSPATSYAYAVAAFDSTNGLVGRSGTNVFSTTSSSRIRSHYTVLAIAFYPSGPNVEALSHIRTYLRHKLDFLRLASVNSAILHPYKNDVLCLRAAPPLLPVGGFNIDYTTLVVTPYPELDGYSMVDLVEKGDIDVVLVTTAPDGCNFYENALVGNKDLNPNPAGEKWHPWPAKCSRYFFVNTGCEDARVYDAYAHYVEGVMSTLSDGYPANWPRTNQYPVYTRDRTNITTISVSNLHLFERFRLADQWAGASGFASPGNGNCGTSHFPPNSRRETDAHYDGDYAYYDTKTWQRYIDCAADDWLRFPTFTGLKRKLNGYDFGAFHHYTEFDPAYGPSLAVSPELHPSFRFGTDSYHQWWFFHLPHNPGVTDGKLNSWWPYLFDFTHFNGSRITHSVTGFPSIPTSFPAVNAEYGTESSTAEWWGYWHSCSDFGPFGQVSVLTNAAASNVVKQGQYALQVLVDQEWFQHNGRNDLFYPISRNARWDLSDLASVRVCIKPGLNPGWIAGADPVIRLCANGGNRIEFVPLKDGHYVNLLSDPAFQGTNGWFTFVAPIDGSPIWEVNVIGYVDPALGPQEVVAARRQLKTNILAEVNYVEISVRSIGSRGTQVSYFVDGLEFQKGTFSSTSRRRAAGRPTNSVP